MNVLLRTGGMSTSIPYDNMIDLSMSIKDFKFLRTKINQIKLEKTCRESEQ